jgi:hypothetical protein
MATSSTIPDVLDYLQEQLSRRSGLVGVQVVSVPLPINDAQLESIQLDSVEAVSDWASFGNQRRSESYDITGVIYLEKPGAGETAGRAARNRAYELKAEIEAFLVNDHRLGGLVASARYAGDFTEQGGSPNGARVCRITFTIHVETQLTKS